ncbi:MULTISPECIES: DNA polymerase III subunit delta [unclassified Streptococcus]|jgi:DNA polymerase III, delta subunit|uniref:DNA polymerase III subunit delta n=1 Tax=Streptococcus TaxID=1301 RepID=UPI00065FEF80|nr:MULTISPECIES: DNA polymerase III subunit delta [unclassified Streptococcus]MCF4964535.1 DNA polymerase III subunit delta [Streptococcus sp. GS001]RSK05800.1 DNA polymerase III subunit delta [Streptococcus sp. A12]
MQALQTIKKISAENLPPILVLSGDDIGQFEWMKEQLLKKVGYDSSDLNYSYFDMKETAYSEVELDLVSLPFFADEKIVILDHFVDVTTAKKRYLTDDELQSFEGYLSAPLETTRLIVIAEGKLDSKRRIVKLLKRDAQLLEATELKEQELRAHFAEEIKSLGLAIDSQAFDQLLIKSGFDFSEIQKNLEFLKTYKGASSITITDIEEAILKTLQDNLFDLIQMILKKQIDSARSLVKDLRLQGEDEIKLLAILLSQFRIYTQVKLLKQEGRTESQIVSDLSELTGRKVNPYQVKFALRDSRGISLSYLEQAICLLIDTDFQMKSGTYEKDYLFDLAVLKLANPSV